MFTPALPKKLLFRHASNMTLVSAMAIGPQLWFRLKHFYWTDCWILYSCPYDESYWLWWSPDSPSSLTSTSKCSLFQWNISTSSYWMDKHTFGTDIHGYKSCMLSTTTFHQAPSTGQNVNSSNAWVYGQIPATVIPISLSCTCMLCTIDNTVQAKHQHLSVVTVSILACRH